MLIDIINNTKINKYLIAKIFFCSIFFFSVLYFGPVWYEHGKALVIDSKTAIDNYATRQIIIGSSTFTAYVSDTNEKRIQGLSNQTELGPKKAMLFIFERSGLHTIWMKDMNFSIDIIWVNQMREVVHIVENASPEGYRYDPPEVFKPTAEAIYIIEVKAGTVKKDGIKLGDLMSLL